MNCHGRNSITKDSLHICFEQIRNGDAACSDFMKTILGDGIIYDIEPTMLNETDVRYQEEFAHIDHDRKLIYCSLPNPNWVKDNFKSYSDNVTGVSNSFSIHCLTNMYTVNLYIRNLKRHEHNGWKFIFNTHNCPEEYSCINSIPCTIEDFIADNKWYNFITDSGWYNYFGPEYHNRDLMYYVKGYKCGALSRIHGKMLHDSGQIITFNSRDLHNIPMDKLITSIRNRDDEFFITLFEKEYLKGS